jgi:hypothetical protein
MEAWLRKLVRTPDHGAYGSTSNRSRSDPMMVGVGFTPRIAPGMWPRRVARLEQPAPQFMRRYATRAFPAPHRGLKPTATVASSLRDAAFGESRRDSISQPRVGAPAPTLGAPGQNTVQPQPGCIHLLPSRFRWSEKQKIMGRRSWAPQGPMKVAGGKPRPQGEAHPPGRRSPFHCAPEGRMNRCHFPPCAPPGRRPFSNLHRWVRAAERRFPPATFIGAFGTNATRDSLRTCNPGLDDGIPLGISGSCPFVSIRG